MLTEFEKQLYSLIKFHQGCLLHSEGVLEKFAKGDYELSIYVTDTIEYHKNSIQEIKRVLNNAS